MYFFRVFVHLTCIHVSICFEFDKFFFIFFEFDKFCLCEEEKKKEKKRKKSDEQY